MAIKCDVAKKITFVGVVFITFVMLVVVCVHDIVSDEEPSFDKVTDVMADASETSDITSDYSEIEFSSVDTVMSEATDESVEEYESTEESYEEEGFMVGATHEILDGVSLSSPYCFVYDATDNVILYEKNAYDKCYPASVTKLLTAAVAMEYAPLETVFKVGAEINMVGHNSSMAYITEGQSFTLNDLLYALLLPSGNDAAYTIAVNISRYVYGDSLNDREAVESFMELCKNKLLEIGAYNTNFSVPDGYHSDDHYTTAYDMMLISLYATSFEEIEEVCGTSEYYCKSVEGESYGWLNSNPLMKKRGQYYCELVTGLKTGSTDEAGKCLATLAEKDGKKLYIVILGSSSVEIRNNDTLEVIHNVLGY